MITQVCGRSGVCPGKTRGESGLHPGRDTPSPADYLINLFPGSWEETHMDTDSNLHTQYTLILMNVILIFVMQASDEGSPAP